MSSGWKLPYGRKPLPVIKRLPDPADQVIDLVVLLDSLLTGPIVAKQPRDPAAPKGEQKLGDIVSENMDKFTVSKPDLFFSLGARNFCAHAGTDRSYSPEEVCRAAGHLTRAIYDLLRHVDDDVRAAVLSDPLGTRATPSLREIEKITDPCTRLFALRDRLETLLIARDAREGRWNYALTNGDQCVTLQHRIDQHLSDLAEISPPRLRAALGTCAELQAQSAADRAARPMRDYFDAIADLTHAVRILEPAETFRVAHAPLIGALFPQFKAVPQRVLLAAVALGILLLVAAGWQLRSLVSDRKSSSITASDAAPPSTVAARSAIDELRPLVKAVADARTQFYAKNDHARRLAIPEFESLWREMARRNPPVTNETLRSFYIRLDQIEMQGSQTAATTQLRQLERQVAETKASLVAFNNSELRALAALEKSLAEHRAKVPDHTLDQLEEQRRQAAAVRAAEEERIKAERARLEVQPFVGKYYCTLGDYGFTIGLDRTGRSTVEIKNPVNRGAVVARPGDVIVRLHEKRGEAFFTGEQMFSDGRWYPITVELLSSGNLKLYATDQIFDGRTWEAVRQKSP